MKWLSAGMEHKDRDSEVRVKRQRLLVGGRILCYKRWISAFDVQEAREAGVIFHSFIQPLTY